MERQSRGYKMLKLARCLTPDETVDSMLENFLDNDDISYNGPGYKEVSLEEFNMDELRNDECNSTIESEPPAYIDLENVLPPPINDIYKKCEEEVLINTKSYWKTGEVLNTNDQLDIIEEDWTASDTEPLINLYNRENKVPDLENNGEQKIETNIGMKKIPRRRKADPSMWIRNKRKNEKRAGLPYVSSRKKFCPGKSMIYKDCSKCPRKCNTHFSNEDSLSIFRNFWKLASESEQRQFIGSLVSREKKQVTRTGNIQSRRAHTYLYNLSKNSEKIRVCKGFFLSCLNVTDSLVTSIMQARNENYFVENSKRGKCESVNKIPEIAKNFIKSHINSFPRVPSHYTRKDTSKEYLEKDLNLQTMYELYVEKCVQEEVRPEKCWLYRNIFKNEFNISFHKPRKDICDTCYVFNHSTVEEKEISNESYQKHMDRKSVARKMKNDAKIKAVAGECTLIEFDLEAVCYTPATNAKALFYKRRLAVYNFTVLNVAQKEATCYMWHEGTANRGSNEIASCLWKYLNINANGKEVVLFSDTCGGQNRNANMAAFCLYAVNHLDIPVINHMFFEPGHSQMEVDNIHAQIEKAKKNVDIYDPSGWYTLIRAACKKNPYIVHEIDQADIKNFAALKSEMIKNKNIDINGDVVNWLKITWLQFRKNDTAHIFFKYDKGETEFKKIEIVRQRSRKSMNVINAPLEEAYTEPIPINKEKKQNLMELCQKGIIKSQYHQFYASL